MSDFQLDRAVAPNLFDVASDPELVFPLVLANLMSPRLWQLRDHLARLPDPVREPGEGSIPHFQEYIDHHFEHVAPDRIAETNGVLDLDAEAERLGATTVDHAVSILQSAFRARVECGHAERGGFALDLIRRRKFPSCVYATVDEAWANRRLLQRRKHKPLGLTCCLDEAAIFAALLLTQPQGSVDDVVFIAAPTHYSVFFWMGQDAWWFYSKHDFRSAAGWSRLVAQTHAGDAQAAFDARLHEFDRIIAASGTCMLSTGETSIDRSRLAAIFQRMDRFFGIRLAQLDRAAVSKAQSKPTAEGTRVAQGLWSASGAGAVAAAVRRAAFENGDPTALRALCLFRALDVPGLNVYLRAARRGARISDLLVSIGSTDDAVRAAASVPGNESIFENPDRIAMPDETVRLGTGTDRDKALLLHVLLEHALDADDQGRRSLETLFTDAVSSEATASASMGRRWRGCRTSRAGCSTGSPTSRSP